MLLVLPYRGKMSVGRLHQRKLVPSGAKELFDGGAELRTKCTSE